MLHRWPNTGNIMHQPRPQVVAHKLLGGVDQATLRQSLSRGDSDQLVVDIHSHNIIGNATIDMHLTVRFGYCRMMCFN